MTSTLTMRMRFCVLSHDGSAIVVTSSGERIRMVNANSGIERIRIVEHANAAHANDGSEPDLLQGLGRDLARRGRRCVPVNGREHLTVGHKRHTRPALPPQPRARYLAFNRNQIEDVVARCQLMPCGRLRRNGGPRMAVLDCSIRECQKSIMETGEAGYVSQVAHLGTGAMLRVWIQKALCAILQHDCRARLVISYRPVNPDSLRKNLHVVAIQDAVHRRDGKGQWTGGGTGEGSSCCRTRRRESRSPSAAFCRRTFLIQPR